jgi:hypothetical protein
MQCEILLDYSSILIDISNTFIYTGMGIPTGNFSPHGDGDGEEVSPDNIDGMGMVA